MPNGEKKAGGSVSESNLISAIAYIGVPIIGFLPIIGLLSFLVPIITYFVRKDERDVRFHSIQSLLLTIVLFIIVFIISFMLALMLGALTIATLGVGAFAGAGMLALFGLVVLVIELIIYAYLAYKAYKGEKYMIPVLGKYSEKWSEKPL